MSAAAVTGRRAFLAALAISIAISFTGIFDHSLWTPDEPRVAAIGREMLVSGDYVVPTLTGQPFLEKPPLGWWVMTALYRLFGVSDGVARATSALAGLLTLLLVFDATRRVSTPFAGVLATAVAGTTAGFYLPFHDVLVDPWLALAVMLGYWGVVVAAFPHEDGKPPAWAVLTIYAAGGLAFLVKGPVGPAVLGGPAAAAIVVGRRWSFFRSWAHVPGALLFLALCALWPLMLYQRGGTELMNGFVVDNILHRFSSKADVGAHKNPAWYYLGKLPVAMLPWLIVVPAACVWLWKRRIPPEWNRPALLFLASVLPVGTLLLSIPGTKRQLYLLPLFGPFGALVGAWLAATWDDAQKLDRRSLTVLFGLVCLLFAAVLGIVGAVCIGGQAALDRVHVVMRSKPNLALVIPFLAGLTLAVVGLGLRARERRSLVVWMVLAVFVLGAPAVFHVADTFKNLHHLSAGLLEQEVLSPDLVCYKLDEVTRGLVPFDTGIVPRHIPENDEDEDAKDQLRRAVAEGEVTHVLLIERRLRLVPKELRPRLKEVRRWPYTKRRTYILYELAAP
jgi:4-amino-4-deoxy-L-arabinose transferase-like glycosyltransferase